jgi:hypothetical protein
MPTKAVADLFVSLEGVDHGVGVNLKNTSAYKMK